MWFLPTHKRPEKLLRMARTVGGADLDEDVIVLLWSQDPRRDDYAKILGELPKRWDVWIMPERTCGDKLNQAFAAFPNASSFGFLADDVGLATTGMLGELRRDAESGKFAWPNDGIHGPRVATHPCAPGRFLRALGFWAHPSFPHNGLDTVLYRVSERVGISRYRADLHLTHFHPCKDTQRPEAVVKHPEWDETYRDAIGMNVQAVEDMYRFEAEELPQLVQRVKEAYSGQEIKS